METFLKEPNLINNIVLLLLAIVTGYNTYVSTRTHNLALRTELNTNSMKDALVLATGKASRAEGLAEGRSEVAAMKVN